MLDSAVVEPGWITEPDFLTGIALVQAMPGPLFNIAAYVGNHSSLVVNSQIVTCGISLQTCHRGTAALVLLLLLCCCCFCAATALLPFHFIVHNVDCSSALTDMPCVHDWNA